MSRQPAHFKGKEIPDEFLLKKIKEMVKDGKSPNKMKIELPDKSLPMIRRYYTKIRRGLW